MSTPCLCGSPSTSGYLLGVTGTTIASTGILAASVMAALPANTPAGNIVITGSMGQVADSGVALSTIWFPGGLNYRYQGSSIVSQSAAISVGSSGVPSIVTFNTLNRDDAVNFIPTSPAWNPTSPTILTVPAGIKAAAIQPHALWNPQLTGGSTPTNGECKPFYDGAALNPVAGQGSFITNDATFTGPHAANNSTKTVIILVTPGHNISLAIAQVSGNPLNATGCSLAVDWYA